MTSKARFELTLPPWFSPRELLAYWSRDPRSRSERVEGNTVQWGLRLPSGPALLTAELAEGRAQARLAWQPDDGANSDGPDSDGASSDGPNDSESMADAGSETATAVREAASTLRRLLALHIDPTDFERQVRADDADPLAPHVARRPGLAVPQTATVFDGALWVIAGQQISLGAAFSIRQRLTQRFGRALPGTDLVAPPDAATLAAASPAQLFEHGLTRRKAEYLHDLACQAEAADTGDAGLGLDLEGWRTAEPADVEARLLAIRGLGPWSVNYLLMRSYGFPDQVPVGDAALCRALQRMHRLEQRPDPGETRSLMARYSPHRSLASFHVWASLKD